MPSPISIWKEKLPLPPQASCLQVLKALSCIRRVDILLYLRAKRWSNVVCLAEYFCVTEATISKHLRVLRNAHLVTREQVGVYAKYSLARPLPKLVRVAMKDHLRKRLTL